LTVSAAENLIPPDMQDQLTDFLQLSMAKPMVRKFDFMTLKGTLSDLFGFPDADLL